MTNGGVPAPYLQGTIFPARDRLGGRIALGMGQMTRRFADILGGAGGVALNEAQLQALFTALAQGAASQQVVNYNFEGLVGPPGPPGKMMVQYLPPIHGVGQGGRYGDDAIVVRVAADGYTFVTAKNGTTSPSSVTLTATVQGLDSPTYQWQYWGGAAWENVVGETTAVLSVAAGAFSGERTYRCLVSGSYYDSVTLAHLADGTDAYTVLLTNEAHAVVCNSAGTPAAGELGVGGKAVTDVLVFKGATALTAVASGPGAGEFSVATADTNVTSAKVDHDTVRIDAMSADSGYVTITVNLEGVAAVTKRFTVVKAKAGTDAFADIDIPIPYTGTATKWEACFTNNSPVAGSVAWATFKVKYKGVESTITASNTSNGWLYWDAAWPTVVSSSATRPSLAVGQWLIGYNNGGTFEPSFFSKLITAGFLSVNVLSAIAADLGTITAGTIVMNLGSTYRLRLSPTGLQGSIDSGASYFDIIDLDGTDVVIQGTKIKALSVETGSLNNLAVATGKIANAATKNWNATSGGDTSHVSGGGIVEVLGAAYWNTGASGTCRVDFYYGASLIGSETRDLPASTQNTFTFTGLGSGSYTTWFAFTTISGLVGSANGIIYTRTMEDKGK